MNHVKVFINPSGQRRAYDFTQQNDQGHWVPITIGQVARLGRVTKQTVHAHIGTLSGHVEFDITYKLQEWVSKTRIRQRNTKRARDGHTAVDPSERSRRSWQMRKWNAEQRRKHQVSLRAVGAAPDPFVSETKA